jgi:uncharacterized protein YjbI with pentapeptide repeats
MASIISSGTSYFDQSFVELNLNGLQIQSSQFENCIFNHCFFVDAEFNTCRFVNCEFIHCDLSLVRVPESVFISIRFENSKVIGINWTQADWEAAVLGKPLRFVNSALNHSTFIGVKLIDTHFLNCSVVNVDFRETNLSGTDFSGSDLDGSLFTNTNLKGADLSQGRNYAIDPGTNNLQGAKFSLPEAMSLLYNMDIELTNAALEP